MFTRRMLIVACLAALGGGLIGQQIGRANADGDVAVLERHLNEMLKARVTTAENHAEASAPRLRPRRSRSPI